MLVTAGAADARRHAHHQAVRRLQRSAISAHVLHPGLGIARDHVGRGQGRRAVEAGRRNRNRQRVEAVAFAFERLALVTTSWQTASLTSRGAIGLQSRDPILPESR